MKIKILFYLALFSSMGFYWACTHDDQVVDTGPKITRGTRVHLPGLTAGDSTQWKFDKAHSSVLWQTSYVGAAGLLTGRFNQFGLADVTDAKAIEYNVTVQPLSDTSWAFYENEPYKSFFNGYVQINTSNTGEPGRDTGCNVAGMGTVKIKNGVQNLAYPNLAKIKSKSIVFDPTSNDYIVTFDLTYQGKLAAPLTKTLTGKLKYVPQQRVQFGTSAAYLVFGLQFTFQFNCRDFGIVSTSVADIIQITCNANYNNK